MATQAPRQGQGISEAWTASVRTRPRLGGTTASAVSSSPRAGPCAPSLCRLTQSALGHLCPWAPMLPREGGGSGPGPKMSRLFTPPETLQLGAAHSVVSGARRAPAQAGGGSEQDAGRLRPAPRAWAHLQGGCSSLTSAITGKQGQSSGRWAWGSGLVLTQVGWGWLPGRGQLWGHAAAHLAGPTRPGSERGLGAQ